MSKLTSEKLNCLSFQILLLINLYLTALKNMGLLGLTFEKPQKWFFISKTLLGFKKKLFILIFL